jgi:hypothetical protein
VHGCERYANSRLFNGENRSSILLEAPCFSRRVSHTAELRAKIDFDKDVLEKRGSSQNVGYPVALFLSLEMFRAGRLRIVANEIKSRLTSSIATQANTGA